MPMGRAEGLQQSATKRVLKAAAAWRRDPTDPELTAALIAAIEEREALTIQTTRAARGE